ncbi:hypothetical protein [Quadrisphaera sp. INWT6]|uniref:hypothetical protein n=1 Tax=Quadrisphaera sp. INWT6 TaxID=2596917 RepID=UPI0018923821|nr:hypothetical protein [Quadrisphaera sp. INWT6]MBF5082714.1 hypothetical protein [Quadrisphaera sp. INWT6]
MPDRADADLDELVDLDGDDGSETTPGRRLPRWARSRWAVPAAVTGVVLLLGVAGLQQARASAAAEVGELQRMTSVQLGSASLFFSGAPEAGRPGADGHLEQRVQVGVRNTGDEDLRITPVSTTVEHARVVPGAEGVSLRAGTGGGMTVVLDVDCGAVPPPTSSSSGTDVPPVATDLLRLAVSTRGGSGDTAERDYLLPDAQWGGLGEQLSYACSPDAYGQALSASGQVDDDGRQTVDLLNTTDELLRVELRTSAALRTVVEPALPAEVPRAAGSRWRWPSTRTAPSWARWGSATPTACRWTSSQPGATAGRTPCSTPPPARRGWLGRSPWGAGDLPSRRRGPGQPLSAGMTVFSKSSTEVVSEAISGK